MKKHNLLVIVFLWAFLEIGKIKSDAVKACNQAEWKECLLTYVDAVFEGSGPAHCSNLTSQHPCVTELSNTCRGQLGSTASLIFSPYIPLLERVHEKSCKDKGEIPSCDLSEAKSCVQDFIAVLINGHIGSICRQTSLALNCLSPALERCSGRQRYIVALVADEIQLTSDLWCSQRSCRLDIASKCIDDAMRAINYPAAIEMQSNLICSGVKSSLTCITDQTDFCDPTTIPQSLSDGFMQLNQFSIAFCGTGSSTFDVTSGLPHDLVAPVYLAALTTNEWTSVHDMCSIYNMTVKAAASERISLATSVESLLTWQQVIGLSLDKLSDTCLNNDTYDCKWVTVLANQNPVCEVDKAERCVDMVLLSKLTVDVNLMRTSWETVCAVAYDMIACAQYHTGSCVTSDLSSVMQLTQEVDEFVGYECSQLGASGSQEACDAEHQSHKSCDSAAIVHECIMLALGIDDRCQEKTKIYSCFKDHLHACNSVQKVPAQIFMEWLLNSCTHNYTLLNEDMYSGVSQCKLQYGYNIFNGILAYSDFNTMICTATGLYRQCLADQSIPSLAAIYMQEVDEFYSIMQQTMCVNTQPGSDLSSLTESEDCNLSETAGTVTLSIEFYSNFPFISLKDQEVVCRTYPPFKEQWTYRALSCSASRQNVISDAIVYFDNIHQALCSVSRPDVTRSCDTTRVNMCLEDFGAFTYFATENSDICGKLEETYACLDENTKSCDETTHNALLQEVKAVHSLLGNITCPKMQQCSTENTTDWFPWQSEICSDWNKCLIFGWESCFYQYDLVNSCDFYTEGLTCIEQKLSACDPVQILHATSEIYQWIQENGACFILPDDPPSVTQVYRDIYGCSAFISQTQDVSKQDLCSAIGSYIDCLASTDLSEVSSVLRGVLGINGQLWRKHVYLDCQIANADKFIVGQGFNADNITGQNCDIRSRFCLRDITRLAVTYFHMIPLSERLPLACERAESLYECVMTEAGGCTSPNDRYLLTSAEWIKEGFSNVGTCASDKIVHRECSPGLAMKCISELGHVLMEDMESVSIDAVCSKLQNTSMCVNMRTSGCDYYTRADVAKTFNQVSAIVKSICNPSPPSTPDTSCLKEGEPTMCDLEEALICMVPIQAMLAQIPHGIPDSTWGQICSSIPEMKACVYRTTSGCDQVTMTIVANRLHRLSHRLNDQCPQIYCEECAARSCLVTLQRNLQYENASLCGSIAEAKQCIYQTAGYCESDVSEGLLREITLLVGEDAYLCEITLPSCLQTFMLSAFQVTSYMPTTNMSLQNDYVLGHMCSEASAAFHCVSQHLTSIEGQRLQIMNSTLQKIGNIVSRKCQGSQLQCYTCSNATSNEECNQQKAQTCSPHMQMCGTVFTGSSLNKGCVRPELCQTGCNGTMCSMCCGTSLCNQPWNDVIFESASCQPQTALYCGFQLLTSLVHNETINCITLQESLTCMVQSTQDCMSSQSMALGIHARDLLTRNVMSTCIEKRPVCGCGQCTSMLLLSVVSSPFGNIKGFCKTVFDMYNRTLQEMDFTNCSMGHIQSTAYNLDMAAYMIQGICSMENIDNTTCRHNGLVYSHGSSFMAQDGCNRCTCNNGNVACTLMYCPPDHNQQCPDVAPGQVGICVEMCSTDTDCFNGQICCSNGCGHVCTDPKAQGQSCHYDNITFNTGESFLASDGCNLCNCYDGKVSCTELYCPTGNGSCNYNGKMFTNGDSFPADDGCNSCFCNSGNVACTLMYCSPDNKQCPPVGDNQAGICVEMCSSDAECNAGQLCCSNGCGHMCTDIEPEDNKECNYYGNTYNSGDNFMAADGCNTCFCSNGAVGCTRMYCPTGGDCDILGVQECISEAALPYLVSMATGSSSRHVCLAAANLLKCVEPKVSGCPSNVLDILHSAVWWNIESVHSLCDINDIVWSLYDEWQTNTTVPDTTGKCSLQNAVKCFSDIDESCSSYQSMIDCVYNFTTGCLTVDMVPVLFELEHNLEGRFAECDLVIPEQNVDPFYPIAQCMTKFGKSLNDELTMVYLRHGRLEGVCDNIAGLSSCLYNISNVQPAAKFLIQNLVESLSHLEQLCHNWDDKNSQDPVSCHHCQGFTDMEKCDSMPVEECHPNQVCAMSLQVDPYSGLTMVTKGCANHNWCHMSHGCNAQVMSCVACCQGNLCNSADNMTSHITEAPNPSTAAQPTKTRTTTTPSPSITTDSYGTCQINQISTVLTAHVLRLMTFNFLPIYDREYVCKNFEENFAIISDNLDPNCPEMVAEHVQELIDRMLTWTSDVCDGHRNDEKCMEAIYCVSETGHFVDKNSTCSSISDATACLQSHYQYCNVQGQMSINSTKDILSGMNFVICEPNILTKDWGEEECVSLATSDKQTAKCDVDSAMECAQHILKAFYNPFLSQETICNISIQGLACIRNASYNCSMNALGSMASVVVDIVQRVNQMCPSVWCPADEICSLEPAWECLTRLEAEVEKQMLAGNFSRSICKSITRIHHCILNATQNCNLPGTQRIFQQFNAIALLTTEWCDEEPTYHNACLNSLHHAIDNLINFDTQFVNSVLKTNLQMVLTHHVLSKDFDEHVIKNGMAILGLDSSLWQYIENSTDIIVPGVIGYLFKDRNLEGINLPALSRFIAEVASVKHNQAGSSAGLDGLNLPGGGGSGLNLPGGSSHNGNGSFGGAGLNLPGGTLTNNQSNNGDGDFGYGINLPGGYESYNGNDIIDIGKQIQTVTSLLFRSNTTSVMTIRNQILNILNKTVAEVAYMIDENSLVMYTHHKNQLCNSIHELFHCLYGNVYNSFMTSTERQEFVMTTSLRLLENLAHEMCIEDHCYSCNDLHSNAECNLQPIAACRPMQVCQTRFSDEHYYKGCASALTCEEECKKADGQCYCCNGSLCNEDKAPIREVTPCQIQTAVDAAYDLLNYSFVGEENHKDNATILYANAAKMIMATGSCYSIYQKDFGTEGKRILALLEAENCTQNHIAQHCGIVGLSVLTNLVFSQHYTTSSLETVCNLFDEVSYQVIHMFSEGKCCDMTAVESVITVYKYIHKNCRHLDIAPVCEVEIHPSCSRHSNKNSDVNASKNTTNEDTKQFEEDGLVNKFCGQFSKESVRESSNKSESDRRSNSKTATDRNSNNMTDSDATVEVPECSISDTMDKCLAGFGCSDTALEQLLLCVQNGTTSCSAMQRVPAAISLERFAFSCGKTIGNIQDLISVDIEEKYTCLTGLTTVNVSVAPDGALMSGLCEVTDSVSSCLASSEDPGAPLQKMYFDVVEGNLNRFRDFICSYGMTETEMTNRNTTCDTTGLSETALLYLIFAIASPPVLGNDVCIFAMELEDVSNHLTECSGIEQHPLADLSSWIQREVRITCDANLASTVCQQSDCDITMATTLLGQLSHYLLMTNIDELVFCRKVTNVLHGVECITDNCDQEDVESLHVEMLYVRSIVGQRCPDLTHRLYCDDRMTQGEETNTRNNTNRHGIEKRAVNEPRNGNGTNVAESCNVMQWKMCMNSVTLPEIHDGLYCSKMKSLMNQLSECVLSKLGGCTYDKLDEAVMYYQTFLTRKHCYTDFLTYLFPHLGHGAQCIVPQCSHVAATDCFKHLQTSNKSRCGNLEDIEQCALYATEGCTAIQQSALMTSLQAFVVQHDIPKECLQRNLVSMNTSSQQVIKCVTDFQQHMSDILSGNKTGTPSCHLLKSYLTCLGNALTLKDIPTVVKESVNHLILVTEPAVDILCMHEDEEVATDGTFRKGPGNETCGTEKASSCLKMFSTNVLLLPILPNDGKEMVCSHLSEGKKCLTEALSECSHDEMKYSYFKIYHLIEMLAQLSGVCSPHPSTCSPEIAMECVSSLGFAVTKHTHHEDICMDLHQTKLCIRQSLSRCDRVIRDSVFRVYNPITCKAHSLCPNAILITEESGETPKSCIDPSDVIAHSGTCRPSVALKCLQTVAGEFRYSNETCRNYESSLTCFFNNVNACEDDVTVMMTMYYLLEVSAHLDKICSTTIKHGCDMEQETECNLGHLDDCIEHFHDIVATGSDQEKCLAKSDVKHCFEMSTRSCPRITKLFAKTRFLRNTVIKSESEEHNCNSVNQCAYNYMVYFNKTLSQHANHFSEVVDQNNKENALRKNPDDETDTCMMKLYQCHVRQEELSCIQTNLKMLPEDVHMVTEDLLLHIDDTFADLCAVQMGLKQDLQGCDRQCIECLQNKTKEQNELLMLLTFISDTRNSSSTNLFSSAEFCRLFEKLKARSNMNVSCFDNAEESVWLSNHMDDMTGLYDKYCARPCNTTQADICINTLENDIASLGKKEACLSYNETLRCLEDSLMSCEASVVNQYISEAETIFTNTSIICYIMPTFEISYTSTELVMVEGEMSQQTGLFVTMMTPVMNTCHGSSCYVEVFVSMEEPAVSECSSGQEIPQILMDSCVYIFDVNNTATTHEFNFYPRVDHKVEGPRNVTVNVIAQLWEDGSLATGDVLASIPMVLEDRDTTGVCYLISEPSIRTFDNLLYYSFSQGEFVLFEHDSLPEKVHVGFQSCRSRSITPCPCMVMIQSGDDTFVIDKCRRFGERNHALEFKVYKNNDITEQTKVYALTNRNFFQFVLPSGAIVNVRSGRLLLDIWISPSAMDFGHTTGLCGTYDGDMENDLTFADASVELPEDVSSSWRGVPLPNNFINSWRPENTLFSGAPESDTQLPSEIFGTKCACTNSTCTPTDLVETCDLILGEDITSDLELYTQIIELQDRRKRQAETIWDTIDYNPENPPDQFPTWPTDSGFTEANATQTCETALRNHASWDVCNVAINTTSIVTSCVTNILLTDSNEFVNEYVEEMKVQCKVAVLTDPSIAALLNQTQEDLVSELQTLTCLNDCSNRGLCQDDVCQCNSGYKGEDCSDSPATAPVITSLSENIYSLEGGPGLTLISRQVFVYGSGFENSENLTCHVEQVQVSDSGYLSTGTITSSKGVFLTSGTILCELSGSLPLTALSLFISNNGADKSNGENYIFQDSVCYNCNTSAQICNKQPTSCLIDGQCYAAGVYNPVDPCLLCDPVSNLWIFKPSSTCLTTTSTTPTTPSTSSSTTSSTDSTSSTPSSTSPSPSSTSSTTVTSTSTSSSSSSPSSSTSSSTSPTSSPVSSTESGQEGDTDRQEDNDQQTFNIVIITGACFLVLIIIVTIIFAYRLRRKDKRQSEAGSTISSSEPARKQGRLNPAYNRGELVRPIAGDPVIQPSRITPLYSAAFNTEGLERRAGAPAIYEDDPGLHTVDIEIFDEGRGRSTEMHERQGPVDPDYDNAGLERRYTIPRPNVASSPSGIYTEPSRQGVDVDYDTVAPVRKKDPMPDYYEDDGSNAITRM